MFVAGPSLIEAYDWERKQDWIGIILSPTVEEELFDYLASWSWDKNQNDNNYHYNFLYKYNNIPIHGPNEEQLRKEGFVVFPRTGLKGNYNYDNYDYLKALKKARVTVQDVKDIRKYDETISFISEVFKQYDKETEKEI